MKKLLGLDNPVLQILARVGDLMITNVLFLLCCVPVVTVGASIAAMTKVTQSIVMDADSGIVKTFFGAFRSNFKQATAVWLILAVIAVGLGCNWFLILSYFSGILSLILRWAVGMLAIAVLAIAVYIFPLMVRYENTLRQHCLNAMILTIYKLPRTAGMLFLLLLPVIIAFLSLMTFFKTLAVWFIIGCAVISYFNSVLMLPVLTELEKRESPAEDADTDE